MKPKKFSLFNISDGSCGRPERTTPTFGLEISGFFAAVTLESYYSVLVDRHRQIGDVLHLIVGLDLLHPPDRKLVPVRFGDVERRIL